MKPVSAKFAAIATIVAAITSAPLLAQTSMPQSDLPQSQLPQSRVMQTPDAMSSSSSTSSSSSSNEWRGLPPTHCIPSSGAQDVKDPLCEPAASELTGSSSSSLTTE